MQVKNLDDILVFQCQQCFQFPQHPKQCNYCMRLFCKTCNIALRKCNCNCVNFSDMDPILRHIYDLIFVQCQFCKLFMKLTQVIRHQIKCQYEFNQVSPITLLNCIYCCNQTIIGLQSSTNYCKFCLIPFLNNKNDDKQIILREEQIEELKYKFLRCELCQIDGLQIQMINHQKNCNYGQVTCDCEKSFKRKEFMNHFKLCLNILMQQEKQNLDREQVTLNLTNIQVGQQFLFLRKQYQIFCQWEQYIYLTDDFYNKNTSLDSLDYI